MAQPQHQAPARVFIPPQPAPGPALPAAPSSFPLPPNKRPRLSPGPSSQPNSPYAASSYNPSPGAGATPTNAGSPAYTGSQMQLPAFSPPGTTYTNGHTANMNLPVPESHPATSPGASSPGPQATNATAAGYAASPVPSTQPGATTSSNPAGITTPGVMGPPTRPPERPAKEAEHDFTDTLAGTGIDLNQEEQFATDALFGSTRDTSGETRTGFGYHPPGNKATLYGAGPMNRPPEATAAKTQAELVAESAERAWNESAENLAIVRTQEIAAAFLNIAQIHYRADKIAKEHGIILNLDLTNAQQPMGRMKVPHEFPQPEIKVSVKKLPDSSAVVRTMGSWIPKEALLVDQLALLSIATKQRLRGLIGDADRVARIRQTSSHGEVFGEWAAVAVPLPGGGPLQDKEPNPRSGAESAVSPRTMPLKRPFDATGMADTALATPSKMQKVSTTNPLATALRDIGRSDRDWEEARLRRRNARKEGAAGDGAAAGSRAGSVAPATPGSVAPDAEKAPTKKELKKTQAAKQAEVLSHGTQNETSRLFAGLGGSGRLFGKKSGKSYSWMTAGGSGTSTPTRTSTPGPAGKMTPAVAAGPVNIPLTADGRNRMGTWREDKERGKNIQLRDWVSTLEAEGIELKALQHAYNLLDKSDPK